MQGSSPKTGLFSHSVKNRLFWSFVYILISVWAIVLVYQSLLGEFATYTRLNNSLEGIRLQARIIRWQAIAAQHQPPENVIVADDATAGPVQDARVALKKQTASLDSVLAGFTDDSLQYRFLILRARGSAIIDRIFDVKSEWASAKPFLKQLELPEDRLSDADFEQLNAQLGKILEISGNLSGADQMMGVYIIGVSTQMRRYYTVGYIIFIILLILIFMNLYNGFIRPLDNLNRAFEELRDGKLEMRLDMKGDDEFMVLAAAFNSMVAELERNQRQIQQNNVILKTLYGEREAELKEKKLSLEMAREVQQALIPLSFKRRNLSFMRGFIPYEELSGDFLDIFPLDEKQLGFLFGDIMGKGIPASLQMMRFHSTFKALINDNRDPLQTAKLLNRQQITTGSDRVDAYQLTPAILGRIDLQQMKFHLVNCGHPPPIMWREVQRDVFELPLGNTIIGFDHSAQFEEIVIDLGEGDLLFFYTDGLSDQYDADGNDFNVEHIKKAVLEYHEKPLDEFIAAIKHEIEEFTGKTDHFKDDILYCAIRIEKYPWHTLSFPQLDREAIAESLVALMRDEGAPNEFISDMNLVFEELFSNAFLHGNKGNFDKIITIDACIRKGEMMLRIEDQGDGFDTSRVDFLLDPDQMYAERGRGLYMVKNIVDDIEFNERGNRVTVLKKFDASGECD